jgi:DNA-binding MarR family transcriptional regulator
MARSRKDLHEGDLKRVYTFIRDYIEERNMPPTQREIAEGTYISRSVVIRYLDILAERGLIVREIGLARGLWLPKR